MVQKPRIPPRNPAPRLTISTLEDSNHWLVKGLAELGDTYPWYNVWVSEGRYRCDCFFRAYGYVRKARICSSIATLMLHRRQLQLHA